jgi:hypothetical protein
MSIQVEIENIFTVTNRGKFVAVRLIDPKATFSVERKAFLNGVELTNYLDMPRALDKQGNQRQDLFCLQLKNPHDAEKLVMNGC